MLICATELTNIHTAFHAGAYQRVVDFDTAGFSAASTLPARVLKLRSQIALGQAADVFKALAQDSGTPDLAAVKLLAEAELGEDVTEAARALAEQRGSDNLTVQLCAAIVLARAGDLDAALALLSNHQGSLDA